MSKLLMRNRALPIRKSLQYFLERTTPFGTLARWQRERQLRKKMHKWVRHGSQLPMPHFGKQQVVIKHIRKFSPDVFIETGTYKGKMVYGVMPYVKEIYSIELDQTLCRRVQRRFSGYPHIHILQGQSGQILPKVLAEIDKPCLFWLDAHWSGGSTAKADLETPVMQEMECILNHRRASKHVILIDDARCFTGEHDYPALKSVESLIHSIYPAWTFEVKNDIISIHSNELVSNFDQ